MVSNDKDVSETLHATEPDGLGPKATGRGVLESQLREITNTTIGRNFGVPGTRQQLGRPSCKQVNLFFQGAGLRSVNPRIAGKVGISNKIHVELKPGSTPTRRALVTPGGTTTTTTTTTTLSNCIGNLAAQTTFSWLGGFSSPSSFDVRPS